MIPALQKSRVATSQLVKYPFFQDGRRNGDFSQKTSYLDYYSTYLSDFAVQVYVSRVKEYEKTQTSNKKLKLNPLRSFISRWPPK